MTTLTESPHAGAFLISEGNGMISRDSITLYHNEARTLRVGTVLAKRISETAPQGSANAGNTGNGAIGSVSAGAGPYKEGTYRITCVEPAANGGIFNVEDPDGVSIGKASVGVAFAGAVAFTISDGTTDFVVGDAFDITLYRQGWPNVGEYVYWTHNSGFEPAGILFDDVTFEEAGSKPAVMTARHAEVMADQIIWTSVPPTSDRKEMIALLANRYGIIVRD